MSRLRPEMDVEKPAVRILVAGEVATEILDCIGWGLEEEGIPASRGPAAENTTVIALAKQAACESRLHVGIGVSGRLRQAALHQRDMPDEKPILTAPVGMAARDELIRLGINAARLVKGNPFRFDDGNYISDSQSDIDSGCSPEAVERIVSGIVEALLNHSQKRQGR
jgi:propanediol dehydratase-reactivating factor small subunit